MSTLHHTALLPITALPSVGSALASRFAELNIYRIFDLLLHLPRDYEDRSRVVPIGQVVNGQSCVVKGKIVQLDTRRGLSVVLADNSGQDSLS